MFKAISRWWQKEGAVAPELEAARNLWLGPNTYFQGTLQCQSNVVLCGPVANSRIETSANILIAEDARVMADLSACIVSVRGHFEGTLVADRVEILAGAHVAGKVHVNSIYLDEEAVLDAELFLLETAEGENIRRPEEITSDVITRTVQGAPNPPVEIGT